MSGIFRPAGPRAGTPMKLEPASQPCLAALLLLALLLAPARADDLSDTTLFLLVRTGPNLSEKIIRDTLTLGLKTAGCQSAGVEIQSLAPALFEELEKLIGLG